MTKRKIVVIDDNPILCENTREMLELSNFEVSCAGNGKAGIEVIRAVKPDLILCDIMMPELDGYGVLRAVLNHPDSSRIPFIFLSSKAEKDDFRKGMDLGADDYLVKPFTGEQLLSMVTARLRKAETVNDSLFEQTRSVEEDRISSPGDIYAISASIVPRKLSRKNILYNEGEPAKYLYFVVSGKVKTYRINDQGKEYISEIYMPLTFFGDYSLSDEGKYSDSAEAMADSEVACIPKHEFRQLLMTDRRLHTQFVNFLSIQLGQRNGKLISLAYDSARKRVAEAILFLAQKTGKAYADGVTFAASREDISAISGVSPESVSRNLTDFRSEKLVNVESGQMRILDLAKLKALKN